MIRKRLNRNELFKENKTYKTIYDYTDTINFIKNPFTNYIFETLDYSNIKLKECICLDHTHDIPHSFSRLFRPYYNFNCSEEACGNCCENYCGWCSFNNHTIDTDSYLKIYNIDEIEKIFNLYDRNCD